MTKSKVKCGNCGKSFLRENKYLKRRKQYFCGRACSAYGARKGETRACLHCYRTFYATLSSISRSKASFCSRSCAGRYKNQRRGENSPLYKDGSSCYRSLAFEHHKRECAVCGYDTVKVLQVHHIDKDRTNNHLDNLVILCPTHHVEAHLDIINLTTTQDMV